MREKLLALWRLAVAVLLYPLALAGLIWVGWTGRPVWWAVILVIGVLLLDRSWWLFFRGARDLAKKKRPRR
ncbi:MAG: hypothetical protein AAF926_06075 [Pseudomonadota bacterium]